MTHQDINLIKDTKKRTAERRPKTTEGEWLWWVVLIPIGFWILWMIWQGLKALVI